MKKNIALTGLLVAFLITTFTSAAQGWVMEDRDGSTTYLLGDWVKIHEPDAESFSTIYNLTDRIMIIVNNEDESYAEGTLKDYCQAIKDMTSRMMEGMTPEQREMMEAYMNKEKEGPAPEVEVKSMGSGEKVAGYSTEKYNILVDGELYEEVWISRDGSLRELVESFAKVEPISREMAECSSMDLNLDKDPEFSSAYLDLMKSGMELKSIRHEYGNPNPGTDVVRLEKASLTMADMKPPAGYTKSSFKDFISSQYTE